METTWATCSHDGRNHHRSPLPDFSNFQWGQLSRFKIIESFQLWSILIYVLVYCIINMRYIYDVYISYMSYITHCKHETNWQLSALFGRWAQLWVQWPCLAELLSLWSWPSACRFVDGDSLTLCGDVSRNVAGEFCRNHELQWRLHVWRQTC